MNAFPTPSFARYLTLVAIFTWFPVPVAGGAMTKNIEAVRPRIGQVGTIVEVSIQGIAIQDPREIVFYHPGIRAIDIQPAATVPRQGFAHGGTIIEEVRCKFEIAPDCPLGEHPFRLLTGTNLTCIATFHVSPFPIVDENEAGNAATNDSLDTAMPIAINTTVAGRLGSGGRGDVDFYRVSGKAGQRLAAEVESARIADRHYGDSEFDLSLRVLDEKGNSLAANDDNSLYLQDPVVSMILPCDGDYFVEVRRSIFVPNETLYCLHVGSHRRPLAVFPPGGPSGKPLRVTLLGDAAGNVNHQIDIPHDKGTFLYYDRDEQGTSTPGPLKMRSSPFANLLEANDSPETLVPEIPIAINGIIDSVSDRDVYRLNVTRDQPIHIRVFAATLGSPIDAAIRIRPATSEPDSPPELEIDDSPLTDHDIFGTSFRGGGGLQEAIDPSVIWTPKQDGEYLLEIVDNGGAGGPTGVYRIELQAPQVAVHTVLASATFDWTESMRVTGLAIPKNNRWTVDLSLPTGQWKPLACDFDLVADGLPQGVTMVSPRVPKGATRWPIQFVADKTAQQTAATITLRAIPIDSSQLVETRNQLNVPFINHSGGNAWRTIRTHQYVVGVTQESPFTIEIDQPEMALVRGGEISIPVKINRQKGFTGDIEIRCAGMPRSLASPPPIIVAGDQDTTNLSIGADANAALDTVPLYVIGSTVREDIDSYLGAGHIRVSSSIRDLSVAQPFVELASSPDSIRRRQQKSLSWTVRQITPFDGEATVALLGLPKGVTVVEPMPTITQDSDSVTFELSATDEALLGPVNGLTCEIHVPVGGGHIVQRSGRGTLRIDPQAE